MLRKTFNKFCDQTSFTGFKYLTEPNASKFEYFWWIFVNGIMLAVCGYFVVEIFDKSQTTPTLLVFSKNVTATSYVYMKCLLNQSIFYLMRYVTKVDFPTVTICPRRYNNEFLSDLQKYVSKNETPRDEFIEIISRMCSDQFLKLRKSKMNYLYTLNKISLRISDIISECSFSNVKFKCEDVLYERITEIGVCYSFNAVSLEELFSKENFLLNDILENGFNTGSSPATIFRSKAPVQYGGLQISLAFPIYPYNDVCDMDRDILDIFFGSSYNIPVSSPTNFKLEKDQTSIFNYQLSLSEISEDAIHIAPFRRGCLHTWENHLKFFRSYHEVNCRVECLSNITLQKCGCTEFYMPRSKDTPICSVSALDCVVKVENELQDRYYDLCGCMADCNECEYDVLPLFTEYNDEIFNETITKSHDVFSLHVLTRSLYECIIQRVRRFNNVDYIASVGGFFSLLLGISLLSLFEIIYFFILEPIESVITKNYFRHRRKNQKNFGKTKFISVATVQSNMNSIFK